MEIIHREFLPFSAHSTHASTVEIWDGHPVFAWFGGRKEGAGDVGIYIYNLNGKKEEFLTLGLHDMIPRWNPILVNVDGQLILFEKLGMFCDRWQTFVHNISKWDKNITGKEIRQNQMILPAGLNGPVKSRPLTKGQNKMICGSSVETLYDWTSYLEEYMVEKDKLIFKGRSDPLTIPIKNIFSDPHNGRTCKSKGVIQPTLWEENGKICAFLRSSHGLNKIYFASGDASWTLGAPSTPLQPTNLPNPNCAIDVAVCNDELYLAWNPDTTKRYPLVVSKITRNSKIDCVEFDIQETLTISDDLNRSNFIKKGCLSPELSYPYLIAHDGKLHLTYTYGRSKIEYCVIDPQ